MMEELIKEDVFDETYQQNINNKNECKDINTGTPHKEYIEELYDVDETNNENFCMIMDALNKKNEPLYVIEVTDECNQPVTVKCLEVEDIDMLKGSYKVVEEVYEPDKTNEDAFEINADADNVLNESNLDNDVTSKDKNDLSVTDNDNIKDNEVDSIFDEEQEKRKENCVENGIDEMEKPELEETVDGCDENEVLTDDLRHKENLSNNDDKSQKESTKILTTGKSFQIQNMRLKLGLKMKLKGTKNDNINKKTALNNTNLMENIDQNKGGELTVSSIDTTKPKPLKDDEKNYSRVVVRNSDYEKFFKDAVKNVNFLHPKGVYSENSEERMSNNEKLKTVCTKIANINNTSVHEQVISEEKGGSLNKTESSNERTFKNLNTKSCEVIKYPVKRNYKTIIASNGRKLEQSDCLQYKRQNEDNQIKRGRYEVCNDVNVQHLSNLDGAIQIIECILKKLSRNQNVHSNCNERSNTVGNLGNRKTEIVNEQNGIVKDLDSSTSETNDKEINKNEVDGLDLIDVSNDSLLYHCDECSYKSNEEKGILQHKKLHSKTVRKCKMCNYFTNRPKDLASHMNGHLEVDRQDMLTCTQCNNYRTWNADSLRRHLLTHQRAKETNTFECNRCPYRSKWKHNLIAHQLRHQPYKESGLTCALCPYTTPIKGALKAHMIVHQKVEALQIYKCDQCTFTTKRKGRFLMHIAVHADEMK